MNYFQWAEKQANKESTEFEVVDWPDIVVTEEGFFIESLMDDE